MSLEDARASLSHLSRRLTYLRERGEPEENLSDLCEVIHAMQRAIKPASFFRPPPWESLLGTMSDGEVARRSGVPSSTVWRRRHSLGIAPYKPTLRAMSWDHLLGTINDRMLAEALGLSREVVYRRRQRLNIPPYRKHS